MQLNQLEVLSYVTVMHQPVTVSSNTYVTGPARINHVSANYTELYFGQYLQL